MIQNQVAIRGIAVWCRSGAGSYMPEVQPKHSAGMHTCHHDLPIPCCQESSEEKVGQAKEITLFPKNSEINQKPITSCIHAINWSSQPSGERVDMDYANMKTCSEPLVPAKPKSVEPVNKLQQHARDHPYTPTKYMQTDI